MINIINFTFYIFFKLVRKIRNIYLKIFYQSLDTHFLIIRYIRFIITKSKIFFFKKKRIVVIGDLSLSPSYGGVLTSYGLFNFLRKLQNYKKYIIETIPFYSFSLNSPLYGFDNLSYIERFFCKKKNISL